MGVQYSEPNSLRSLKSGEEALAFEDGWRLESQSEAEAEQDAGEKKVMMQ